MRATPAIMPLDRSDRSVAPPGSVLLCCAMQTAVIRSRPLLAGGWLDLVQTNGWEGHNGRDDPEWASETTRVFRNLTAVSSELTFADVAEQAGLVHRGQGRGLVHLDYDNDGDQDLVIFNNAGSSGRTPYGGRGWAESDAGRRRFRGADATNGGRVRTRAGPRIPRIFMVGHVRVFRLFRRGWLTRGAEP